MRAVDFPFDYTSEEDERPCPTAQLLPDGREMLTLYCGRVELWSLKTKERIWEVKRENALCSFFDFDIVDCGSLLVVAIRFGESSNQHPWLRFQTQNHIDTIWPSAKKMVLPRLQGVHLIILIGTAVIMNWRLGEVLAIVFNNEEVVACRPLVADDEFTVLSKIIGVGDAVIRGPISDLSRLAKNNKRVAPGKSLSFLQRDDKFTVLPLQSPDSHVIEENEYDILAVTHIKAIRAFKPICKPNAPTEIFTVGSAVKGEKSKLKLIKSASAETTGLH